MNEDELYAAYGEYRDTRDVPIGKWCHMAFGKYFIYKFSDDPNDTIEVNAENGFLFTRGESYATVLIPTAVQKESIEVVLAWAMIRGQM